MIRIGGNIRPINDQIRRFNLIKYIIPILMSAKTRLSKINMNGNGIQFFVLINEFESRGPTKVILRKIGTGNIHFFSIMDC
jgi:hypothetical protein